MSDNARRMAKLREMAAAELTPDTDPLAPNEVVISPHRDITISSPHDVVISRGVRRPSSGRLLVSLSNTEREVLDALPAEVSSAAFVRSALRWISADASRHAEVLAVAVDETSAARSRSHLVISPSADIVISRDADITISAGEVPAKMPAKARRARKPVAPPPIVRPCSVVWVGTTGPEWVTLDPEAADDLFPTTREGRPLRGLELPGELADLRAGRIPRSRAHRVAHRMAEVVLGNLLRDNPAPPAAQRAAEGIIDAALTAAVWTIDAGDVLTRLAADGIVTIDGNG